MDTNSLILAIETSSRIGSVALSDRHGLLVEASFSAPLRHSAELFPTIERLLSENNLSRQGIGEIYLSIGPGSFTGLRIAVAVAKAMHLANNLRIVTVGTLDVIAQNRTRCQTIKPDSILAPILDAKRGQFFVAAYECSAPCDPLKKIISDCVVTPQEFLSKLSGTNKPLYLLGDGLLYHSEAFASARSICLEKVYWTPRAAQVLALGSQKSEREEFTDPMQLLPFYMRAPQVTVKKK
jgi:tRNA threonylcarbamoyladenosine biosynthesis protein TsaB